MHRAWDGFSLISHAVCYNGGPRIQSCTVFNACRHSAFPLHSFSRATHPFLSVLPLSPFLSSPVASFSAMCLHSVKSHALLSCCPGAGCCWVTFSGTANKRQNSPSGIIRNSAAESQLLFIITHYSEFLGVSSLNSKKSQKTGELAFLCTLLIILYSVHIGNSSNKV